MAILDYQQVQEQLALHRPLLMLDRAEVKVPGTHAAAIKCVSMNEEFFQGHFPGAPVMPGVLQVAAMIQTATLLLPAPPAADQRSELVAARKIKFRKPVVPGDLLQVEATLQSVNAETGEHIFTTQTTVDGDITCQGILHLAWQPRSASRRPMTSLTPAVPSSLRDVTCPPPPTGRMEEILACIPHRYPFLLIDRVLSVDLAAMRMITVKNVTGNEPFFTGLAEPVVPPFLLMEMAAQSGCKLAFSNPENQGKLAFFMSIDDATFYAPVVPGDQLILDTTAVMKSRFGKGDGKLYVGDQLVGQVTLKFAIVDRNAASTGAEA